MAQLPTVHQAEEAILGVFAKFGVRPNEALPLRVFLSNWDHVRFRMDDLSAGLQALVDSEAIYTKNNGRSFFLSEKGYQRIHIVEEVPLSALGSTERLSAFPQSTTVNVIGPGARINIASTDNSINFIQLSEAILDDLLGGLRALPEQAGLEEAIRAAEQMKEHYGKETFAGTYKNFMAVVADHVTILSAIAPYIGPLAAMLGLR